MDNFDCILEKLINEYARSKKPIEVSFRELIPHLNKSDRATHLIHTYPAKLLMHIPYFFLNNGILSDVNDKILDPFCGSGTVLLETIISGRQPFGADSNPLARLISRTKTNIYDIKNLKESSLEFLGKIDNRKMGDIPNVVNIDYWFSPKIKKQLSSIYLVLNEYKNGELADFYRVCFSNLIKKVSLADPRVSVPVRIKPSNYPKNHLVRKELDQILSNQTTLDVRSKFLEIIQQNIKRFEKLTLLVDKSNHFQRQFSDARRLEDNDNIRLIDGSIQLIISSPPYSGAQKYIRSSSLSLGWLGYTEYSGDLRNFEKGSIGREHYYKNEFEALPKTGVRAADILLNKIFKVYPKRAYISANYLIEMRQSLTEAVRVLKKNGYFVLVIANNQICGVEFKTQEYLTDILESLGLKLILKLVDDIKSYGLMTKRNKTASIITCEWVLVFKK
ncbi:MAG TPA: hypothetical protein VGQ53_07010 [Chitinophagaceae bacterium]|jgi:DNA modification methylase|nr:hypothetical protein [Chitinophagaceae bacterium]